MKTCLLKLKKKYFIIPEITFALLGLSFMATEEVLKLLKHKVYKNTFPVIIKIAKLVSD